MEFYNVDVGASEYHSLEALVLHLPVDRSDMVNFMGRFNFRYPILSSPTCIDIFALLKRIQINSFNQLFSLPLQLSKQRNLWFLWFLYALPILIDFHVESSSHQSLIMNQNLVHSDVWIVVFLSHSFLWLQMGFDLLDKECLQHFLIKISWGPDLIELKEGISKKYRKLFSVLWLHLMKSVW